MIMKRLKHILPTVAMVLVGIFATKNVMAADTLIQEDITSLRDSFDMNLGEGTYAGVSITGDEINNPNIMALVTKHFNAVTFGNELKPDCMFGYSNHTCPELISYDFNGEEFIAPKMDFSRAEKMLNYIDGWNKDNPDRKIKVRGHVLVWHSQTPEWFFHEDYDKSKPYVSKTVMDKRQEWYIKEVITHFVDKYPDTFYGWDVVNEAVSDATGDYRTDTENGGDSLEDDTHGSKSSWWKVYQSNEYIINAFKYANKYAPDYVELYYNDYNECNPLKSNGIIKLLEDVKAAEGTRIDGFGMQGHYDMTQPTGGQVKIAAIRYAEVVGNVALTELDLKASSSYDGSPEEKEKEYRRQYMKYKEIYQALSELVDEGVTVRTVTVWGVIDRNSWLQTFNNVGGGASGKQKQCPLLFDDDYQAKPLFYALCNEPVPEKVEEDTKDNIEEETEEALEATDEVEAVEETSEASPLKEEQGLQEDNKEEETETESKSNRSGFIIILLAVVSLLLINRNIRKNEKK